MSFTNYSSPRRLATSAQVHPNILPFIHGREPAMRSSAARRLPAIAAVACLAYAVGAYRYQSSKLQTENAVAEEARANQQRMAVLDAYGGRDSLEELEMAAQLYQAQSQAQTRVQSQSQLPLQSSRGRQ